MADVSALIGGLGKAATWAKTFDKTEPVSFILEKQSVSIVLIRSGVALAAQDFLLTGRGTATVYWELPSATANVGEKTVIMEAHVDADIKRRDTFRMNGISYEVQFVERTQEDRIEAYAEAQQ